MANGNPQDRPVTCPDCQFGPFERNHFFTGKLMTARDFSDETRYHSERIRHHNARLHGWGVVCGLKVKAHDNPACRDKFVIIEPGTALDCCGNEILVTEAVTVQLDQLPAIADLIKKNDTDPHRLQICVSYKECPTEDVPVLYDDCGCDDSRCAPNRILSSFEVDALLDAVPAAAPIGVPDLTYTSTVNPPHAVVVTAQANTKRMYAIASDQAAVYQLNSDNYMVVATATLSDQPMAMAVSNKGDRLYVVSDTGKKRQLVVIDTAKFDGNVLNTVDLPNGDQGPIYLAVAPAPDNRLFSLAGQAGEVAAWPVELDKKGSNPKPVTVNLGRDLAGLVISSNAKSVYTVDPANNQVAVGTIKGKTILSKASPVDLPENTQPSGLGLVASTAPDLLAVISSSRKSLIIVDPKNKKNLGGTGLDYAPSAVAIAAGGHWAYVLEEAGNKSYVQPVDVTGIQQAAPQVTGEPSPVGDNSKAIVVTANGNTIYVPSESDPKVTGSGGVGVVTVSKTDCQDILWKSLDGCPGCDTPNCVVLATIANYVVGDMVEDQTDPAADPLVDQQNDIARIDNRSDRKLLPSTETLTEVVECLLEQGCDCSGGTATQGPPGNPGVSATAVPEPVGPNCPYGGIKVTDGLGQVSYVCNGKPGTNGLPGLGATAVPEPAGANCPYGGIKVKDGIGQVTYVCNGKPGANGLDGVGLEKDLIQIKALSWRHDQANNPLLPVQRLTGKKDKEPGIVIGFTDVVTVGNPTPAGAIVHAINSRHVFQVFMVSRRGEIIERTQLSGTIVPVKYTEDVAGHINTADEILDVFADGVAFTFDPNSKMVNQLSEDPSAEVWVHLQGDFVVDKDGKKAIDAEYVRAELSTGDRPSGSPYGIQGGHFESWFQTHDTKITG
jgi:hypothetical protein